MQPSLLFRVSLVCFLAVTGASTVRASPDHSPHHTLVVLVPGFGGRAELPVGAYFVGLEDDLAAAGFDVVTLAPPPVATSEQRGAWLAAALDDVLARTGRTPADRDVSDASDASGARVVVPRSGRVVVIAHSQGGVDVRAALDAGARIDAVATLSAPHHGTDVAEVARAWPTPVVRAALRALGWGAPLPLPEGAPVTTRATRAARVDAEDARDAGDTTHAPTAADATDATDRALASLTRDGMRAFNARHPAAPVPFFSVAAFSGSDVDDACAGGRWDRPRAEDALHPMLLAGRAMIRWQRDVSDDGVVPTRSMRFGTFLGCVAADHVDWQRWDVELEGPAFDANGFIVQLARGLDDVARTSSAHAMDAHTPKLAALAGARPL